MTSLHEALAALAGKWERLARGGGAYAEIRRSHAAELRARLDRFPAPDPAPSERVELTNEELRRVVRHMSPMAPGHALVDLQRDVESILSARLAKVEAERDKAEAERDRWKAAWDMAEPVLSERDALAEKHAKAVEHGKVVAEAYEQAVERAGLLAEQVAAVEALAELGEQDGRGNSYELAQRLRAALSDPGTALARVRAEAEAKVLEDAAEALPRRTEGTDRVGTETWRPHDRDVYSLAIEEAQAVLP